MKLKSLLLGSAAALIAVTGARAADAVVADPEPVEYVRVCDMYGAGFFYIPGTETCLKIGGRVRVSYEYQSDEDLATGNDTSNGDFWADARIAFDARNETDLGTLRSWLRLETAGALLSRTGQVALNVEHAIISLGGVRAGYGDSFWARNNGYGLPSVFGGYYGFTQDTSLEYTHAANGFSVTGGIAGTRNAAADDTELDFYAGASYTGSWGRIAGTVVHATDAAANTDDTAYGISVEVNAVENLTVQGWYHADDGATAYIAGANDTQWGIGARYNFAGGWNINGGYTQADGGTVSTDDLERWTVGVGVSPVSGLNVELAYDDISGGTAVAESQAIRLRVTRSW